MGLVLLVGCQKEVIRPAHDCFTHDLRGGNTGGGDDVDNITDPNNEDEEEDYDDDRITDPNNEDEEEDADGNITDPNNEDEEEDVDKK